MQNFDKLTKEIAHLIQEADIHEDVIHSTNTLEWVLKLNPDASEELQIAALAHDIDRAIPPPTKMQTGESYDNYKQRHAKRSAECIAQIMKEQQFANDSIDRVHYLVENHEVGGDEDATILMDADSISYFDVNIQIYYQKRGIEITKSKINFMYSRTTPRAQKYIKMLNSDNDELRAACLEIFNKYESSLHN